MTQSLITLISDAADLKPGAVDRLFREHPNADRAAERASRDLREEDEMDAERWDGLS